MADIIVSPPNITGLILDGTVPNDEEGFFTEEGDEQFFTEEGDEKLFLVAPKT